MCIRDSICFVMLWITEYGEREGMKRYMTDFDPLKGPASIAPGAPPIGGPPTPAVDPAPDPTLKPPTV